MSLDLASLESTAFESTFRTHDVLSDLGAAGAAARADRDRRAHPRLSAHDLRWLRRARLKHGPSVTLIDLSVGGVLLETDDRLCPGLDLTLEIVGSHHVIVPLRVIRAQIASLRDRTMYRGACEFSQPLAMPDLLLQSGSPLQPGSLLKSGSAIGVLPCPANSTETGGTSTAQLAQGWSMVVLGYLDGKSVRGFSNDFSSSRTHFHLCPSVNAPSSQQMIVPLSRLKAVFFVRNFDGNPTYIERQTFDVTPHGRKMEVTFLDGETMIGSTLSYRPEGSGFFLCPADPRSNNLRIFVVCSSVRHARFI
jgi:hypothetical protein